MKKRLFWAVNLPRDLKAGLAALQKQLQVTMADVKWVEEENLHVTVFFMGEVEGSVVGDVVTAVEKVASRLKPFVLEVEGIGTFPRGGPPRVLWVGIRGEVQKMVDLHRSVSEVLAPYGFTTGEKSLSPHLTLGRFRSSRGRAELMRRVEELSRSLGPMGLVKVDAVDLMESRLTPRGPVYSILASVPLGGVNGEV